MSKFLFLIFNHQFSAVQDHDAQTTLGVDRVIPLPAEFQGLWGNIPPDMGDISEYLEPIRRWLDREGRQGDYVLIQGDFGACYLMVGYSFERGLIPVYSTTERVVHEELGPNGSVKLTHQFQHRIFRRYGR